MSGAAPVPTGPDLLRRASCRLRTGNAARKFIQVDTYVWKRLKTFLVKRQGRNLRPGDGQQ